MILFAIHLTWSHEDYYWLDAKDIKVHLESLALWHCGTCCSLNCFQKIHDIANTKEIYLGVKNILRGVQTNMWGENRVSGLLISWPSIWAQAQLTNKLENNVYVAGRVHIGAGVVHTHFYVNGGSIVILYAVNWLGMGLCQSGPCWDMGSIISNLK